MIPITLKNLKEGKIFEK